MSAFLDTRGKSTLAVAICDRCKMKRPAAEMRFDGDRPGLRVCSRGCSDQLDPYKLPARQTEDIAVPYPRPDEDLVV
jgi:hypothetical protein